MDALRRLTEPSPLRARTMVAVTVAVVAVIVGLIAMHVLGGGTHGSHDAGVPAAAHAMQDDSHDPRGLECGSAACEGLGMMAVGCALALLAVAVLLIVAPVRWGSPTSAPPLRSAVAPRRALPRPSLIELSISRT